MVTAVDAVDTFPAFSYVLLIAPRVSFCRGTLAHDVCYTWLEPD
jgi:hypothetical protein